MTPQIWIALTGLFASLFAEPVYGPPAPSDARAPSVEVRSEAPAPARGVAAQAEASPAPSADVRASSASPDRPTQVAQRIPMPSSEQQAASEGLTAEQVVEGVQSFYEETEHLTAVFRQVYTNQTFGRESVSDGRVWLKKPGKMRWDYQNRRTGEVHKSFISDGSRLWALEHDNKQAFRKDLEDTVLPVAVTFLTGEGELLRDFRASIDRSGTYGTSSDYVLRLVPRRPSAQYKTLWLVVDPEDFRVKQSIVLEASGNTNHFRFFEPDTQRPVRDSWFEVDPSALRGYRIIDPE
jgi:outer membrane lipoprotein carrier protein